MLIHLGDNEFVRLDQVVGIFPIDVVNPEIVARLGKIVTRHGMKAPKSAVLTRSGKWVGSTISSEALAERGYWRPKPIRPGRRKSSESVDPDEETPQS
ncbi:MAG TPA: hypothetical protein PKO06_15970 [Candidatus Ozemobacteraceae bacterium]|nr:hypothetical protein [Candidatus Ozemobacteraceae bacterium]